MDMTPRFDFAQEFYLEVDVRQLLEERNEYGPLGYIAAIRHVRQTRQYLDQDDSITKAKEFVDKIRDEMYYLDANSRALGYFKWVRRTDTKRSTM